MKNLKKRDSSHEDHFPKILFTLSRCRIAEDNGSEDLLSRSQMHIDERNRVVLVTQQWMRQNAEYNLQMHEYYKQREVERAQEREALQVSMIVNNQFSDN